MDNRLSVDDIRALGFEWPKHALIEQYCVTEHDKIDLVQTLHELQSSRAFYQQQISQAYAFRQQTGADYVDFTDRHDDNVQMKYRLERAVAYLESILEALGASQGTETDG